MTKVEENFETPICVVELFGYGAGTQVHSWEGISGSVPFAAGLNHSSMVSTSRVFNPSQTESGYLRCQWVDYFLTQTACIDRQESWL